MPTLDYVVPTDSEKELINQFRKDMNELYTKIVEQIPEGRGKSLALTKLEEASMWLNKAITNNA